MTSIISSGIGSGLDIAGIVQSLVAAEGQPVETRINQQEARAQSILSAYGSVKSILAELRDKLELMKSLDSFLSRTATSGNEDFFTVSAGSTALPASYALEVVQLAQAQKLTSGTFTDADAVVGTGTLTLTVGAVSSDIEIDSTNNTVSGIRDAINAAPDNPGVQATIVNADSGSYLILTAESTGAAQSITVTQSGGDGGLSALEYDPANSLTSLSETVAAADAQIRIDGFDIFSDTNTFVGAIDGVTITAVESSAGATESLSIANDPDAAKQLINDFVESYNTLIDTFDSLTAYDAEAETAAPLLGDASIRGIRDQIRRELSIAVTDLEAPFSMLSDVGVEVQLDGKLQVNDPKLSDVLGEDFQKLGELFSTTDGFAVRLYDQIEGFLNSDGIIEARTKGLEDQISGLDDERIELSERLSSLETRLFRRFNALDSLLAQLSSTSSFLTQQLDNLPGVSRSGSSG
ncbi:MAG: flagellar filament capping protein FliD [Pseudomonadota bacterium]